MIIPRLFTRVESYFLPNWNKLHPFLSQSIPRRALLLTPHLLDTTSSSSVHRDHLVEDVRVPHTKAEYLQRLLMQLPNPPPDARTLKIAVIGCPNAGKSSLVNMLTKWRVCAVSGKAHTTRSKQMAAIVKENIQLVFVDLPGIVNKSKRRQFNLDKSFMRDPHAASFESDLIMVVVDVSHSRSRSELDPEIVKALHFFDDKESILVLNKIDLARNDPTRLLDATRRLTRGIVNGRRWHLDAYQARFNRRSRLAPTAPMLQPPSELIAAYLPAVCHQEANKLLNRLAELRAQLNPPVEPDDQVRLLEGEMHNDTPVTLLTESSGTENELEPLKSKAPDSSNQYLNRTVTEVEAEAIDTYFEKYKPQSQTVEQRNSVPDPCPTSRDNTDTFSTTSDDESLLMEPTDPFQAHQLKLLIRDDPYLDAVLDALKEQLLLHSASREEVAARRKRWLDVSLKVQGVTNWPKFSAVFMVSSANGDGVDKLRDYLLQRAIPGRPWFMSPSLVTDQEPSELVRMCVWAHCLNLLRQEIPYSLRIVVDECEKARLDDGDDRVFVHARIQCKSERHLRQVLGIKGSTITELASAVKQELMTMFRSNVVVKLTAEMLTVRPDIRQQLRKARDFAEVFPGQARASE